MISSSEQSCVGEGPLRPRLASRWAVDEGKIGNFRCSSAIVASRQELSVVTLEGPFSVGLFCGSPLGVRSLIGVQVSEGRVFSSCSSPASIASWKPVSVGGLEDNLGSDSRKFPFVIGSASWLDADCIGGSTTITEFQEISVISLKRNSSSLRQVGVLDVPLGPRISWIRLMDEGKVWWGRASSASIASGQVFAIISFEGIFAIWLKLRSPKGIGFTASNMHKGWVRISSSGPATVASGKVKSIASLEGHLTAYIFQCPHCSCVLDGLNGSRIRLGTSTVVANSQVLSIVSNESHCSWREVNTSLVDLVKMDGVNCAG